MANPRPGKKREKDESVQPPLPGARHAAPSPRSSGWRSRGGAREARTDLVSAAVAEELTRLAYRDRVVAFGVNRTTV